MKKYIIAIVMCICAQVVNAQTVTEPKTVSDYEFSNVSESTKLNYYHQLKERGAYEDMILTYVGNNLEPYILYTQRINTWYAELYGVGAYMADEVRYGGGIGIGYEGRDFLFSGRGILQTGKEDIQSDVQATFQQYRLELAVGYKLITWNAHHDYIAVIGGISMQRSSFHDLTSTTSQETSSDGHGTTTTTTTTKSDLFVNEFTSGAFGGVEYTHHFRFSPWSLCARVQYGIQQNIVLNTNIKYGDLGGSFGVKYRFRQKKSYNYAAMQHLGLSTTDVWNMRNDKPYQKK
jgi:hypothetical protein